MSMRLLVVLVCLAVCGVAIVSALGHGTAGPAKPPPKPQLYMSPTGSDSNPCTSAAPCASFQRAYNVAQPGQVVVVGAGSYPQQTIQGSKALPKVVFQPAAGGSVSVAGLEIYASNFELRNMSVGYWNSYASSNGFVARNLDISFFGIYGSSNLSILGGDIGPSYDPGGTSVPNYITYGGQPCNPPNCTVAPTNILIDGAHIHDFRRGTPDEHMECIHVVGGDGITIRNSVFARCDVFDVYFTQWAGPAPAKNVRLENNFFGPTTLDGSTSVCCTYYSVFMSSIMDSMVGFTLDYNSAVQPFSVEAAVGSGNQFIANVAPNSGCVAGITYRYNVWDGASCSASDKNAPSSFVDPNNNNLDLKAGAAAINAGDPTNYPAADIHGTARPRGSAPDAGADEAG
jgi:hypothetical protein